MYYIIQVRECGKWRTPGYNNRHATVEAAEAMARRIDEDGLFLPTVRIMTSEGDLVKKGTD